MAPSPDSNPLARLVERTLTRLRFGFLKLVAGNAVRQNADGSLQFQPDSASYPSTNPTPYRLGIPGTTCKVAPGARCMVAYADADPGRPVVVSWEKSTLQELVIAEGSAGAARVGDTVDAGYLTVITAPLGLGGAAVVQSVVWAPPGTSPAPVSVPPLTIVYHLVGRISSGSSVVKVG